MSPVRIEDWQARFVQGAGVDLVALERALRELESEIQRDEAEIQSRRTALDSRKRDLEALTGLRNFLAHGHSSLAPASNGAQSKSKRAGKPGAIVDFLRGRERSASIPEIRDALVERGVIEDSPGAYHGLQVTLSQMFRKGEVERPRMGFYKLPSTTSLTREAV